MEHLGSIVDPGSFHPVDDGLRAGDPLGYPGYRDALAAAPGRAGTNESVVAGPATVGGRPIELAAFSFAFMAGSMGEVAGERLARAMERAAERGVPFVLRTATGGARLQEGMRSLVQMPKVVSARLALARAHLPFITVLGNPTTGGVLASVAALADLTFAESDATVGFAGPRIAERATGKKLRSDSHTAARAFERGLVDGLVEPRDVAGLLSHALEVLSPDEPRPAGASAEKVTPDEPHPTSAVPSVEGVASDAWEAVTAARDTSRPKAPALARDLADDLIELRGDRAGRADPALFLCIARVLGRRCVMVALDREHLPGVGAYRAARRALDLAARLDLPVVTLIDTRGADPSEASEAEGIAWEVARTFEAFLSAPVPVVSIVTGEGGSGGALALACGDVLLAFERTVFSVIGPELAAEILWRDSERAPEAARLLHLTATDLVRLSIADSLLPEPPTGDVLAPAIARQLDRLTPDPTTRQARWRAAWR